MTTNEILTRAAEVLERSVTLENQTIAAELRRFYTAQREALARVEAERDRWKGHYQHLMEQHMPRTGDGCDEGWSRVVEARELQAQLAEAVGLLEKVTDTTGWDLRDGPLISQVHDFLVPHREAAFMKAKGARHAQAEQQEARNAEVARESLRPENQRIEPIQPLCNPRSAKFQAALEETFRKFESMSDEELEAEVAAHMPQQEAQGAQAGDERAAFESAWSKRLDLSRDKLSGCYYSLATEWRWEGWQKRAALATQPAAPAQWKIDEVALEAAKAIMGMFSKPLPIGGECQRQAQIQCLLIDTIHTTQPAVRGAEHE